MSSSLYCGHVQLLPGSLPVDSSRTVLERKNPSNKPASVDSVLDSVLSSGKLGTRERPGMGSSGDRV